MDRKTEIILKISKMNLNEIADLILELEGIPTPSLEDQELLFYGNIDDLKPFILEQKLIGTWRISEDNKFTQLVFRKGNINFYKTGTILVQGPTDVKESITLKLKKALYCFSGVK